MVEGVRRAVTGQRFIVQRGVAFAAYHRGLALVQFDPRASVHARLRGREERVQRLAQVTEPQPIIDEFPITLGQFALHGQDIAGKRQRFQRLVRRGDDRTGRQFVDLAALDAHHPVFHHVDASNPVTPADFVQRPHQLHRIILAIAI